ncbi:MAG TPA: hypothetical protein DCW95_05650 [Chryseobacterium sp.]|nr:hypothetical protein [Chryseobacterium sp.]
MTEIGNRIKEIRKSKGLSQGAVASQLGVSQATYGKIEKNSAQLSIDKLDKMAQILGVSGAELLGWPQANGSSASAQQLEELQLAHDENKEVMQKLLQSKDEQIEVLKELIKFYREKFNQQEG